MEPFKLKIAAILLTTIGITNADLTQNHNLPACSKVFNPPECQGVVIPCCEAFYVNEHGTLIRLVYYKDI